MTYKLKLIKSYEDDHFNLNDTDGKLKLTH